MDWTLFLILIPTAILIFSIYYHIKKHGIKDLLKKFLIVLGILLIPALLFAFAEGANKLYGALFILIFGIMYALVWTYKNPKQAALNVWEAIKDLPSFLGECSDYINNQVASDNRYRQEQERFREDIERSRRRR